MCSNQNKKTWELGARTWGLGAGPGSWEPGPGSWELELGVGNQGDLRRPELSDFPEVVGDLKLLM